MAQTHDCPYCKHPIDLGDWSPYASTVREATCPSCEQVANIEWDDDLGWYAWLSAKAPDDRVPRG